MDASFSSESSTWSSSDAHSSAWSPSPSKWSSSPSKWAPRSPSSDAYSPLTSPTRLTDSPSRFTDSPTSSPNMISLDPPGYLTPVEDADQASVVLSAASHRLRPYASSDPELARLVYLLQVVQQQLVDNSFECSVDEELGVNLPALLHSISRNFTPRLQNVSRFKKFLAATRIMESLEDYALYLASVRLAPDRTSFEMHAARYKPPRSLSPSSSMSGGSTSIPAGSRSGGSTSGGSTSSGSRRHVTFGGSRVHDSGGSMSSTGSNSYAYPGTMRSGSSGHSTEDSWTSSTRLHDSSTHTSGRQLAFPYRELSVKLQPHEAVEKYRSRASNHSTSRRRKDSIDNYQTPGLAELYVDPDWF